jgi:hypothetical protein
MIFPPITPTFFVDTKNVGIQRTGDYITKDDAKGKGKRYCSFKILKSSFWIGKHSIHPNGNFSLLTGLDFANWYRALLKVRGASS